MNLNANTFGQFLFGDMLPVNILDVTEDRYLPQIQQFVAQENAFLAQLTSILADRGTEVQTGFINGIGGRMHKITKRGGAEATRGGQKWWTGYPINAYGSKQTYEIPWLQRAKFIDLAQSMLTAVVQDVETMIVEMFRALLRNDTYTFDDSQWPGMHAVNLVGVNSSGPVTVAPLANADGSLGSVYAHGREVLLANLNHYLVSGASNPTAGAFDLARAALRNVGNDQDMAFMVSRSTADYIQANFSATDFTLPVEILQTNYAQDAFGKYGLASRYGILGQTIRGRGRIRFGELVEAPHFPDGYMLAWNRAAESPLRIRESDLPAEQGFGLAPEDPGTPDIQGNPLARKQWRRIYGIGARNRVNGVVVQFTTAGSYTPPVL